jgi:hypothetical protein
MSGSTRHQRSSAAFLTRCHLDFVLRSQVVSSDELPGKTNYFLTCEGVPLLTQYTKSRAIPVQVELLLYRPAIAAH